MKTYRHLFFDLDHTLWDFERNSEETIYELFDRIDLKSDLLTPKSAYETFSLVNRLLWNEYHFDRITKEELRKRRFEIVLEQHGMADEVLAEELSNLYLQICPTKPHLVPNTIDVLDYLTPKYALHLISNGFQETTEQKLIASSLQSYFQTVCTPNSCGYKKPQKEIFSFALAQAEALPNEAVMIGDDLEADIMGAQRFGIHQIYYNPLAKAHTQSITYEIRDILELKILL